MNEIQRILEKQQRGEQLTQQEQFALSLYSPTGQVTNTGGNVSDVQNFLPFTGAGLNTMSNTQLREVDRLTGFQSQQPVNGTPQTDDSETMIMDKDGTMKPKWYIDQMNGIEPSPEDYREGTDPGIGNKVSEYDPNAPEWYKQQMKDDEKFARKQSGMFGDEDKLRQAALISNMLGAGIDLNSSLYLLGKGIGDKNKGLTIGAAGKSILAGGRSFLSGLSTAKRNKYTEDYMDEQMRKGMIGNYYEADQSAQDVGGYLFADGGIKIKEENRGKFTAKAKRHKMGVQEFAHHVMSNKENFPSETVKQANFAINAKKWNAMYGGKKKWEDGGNPSDPYSVFEADLQATGIFDKPIPEFKIELSEDVDQVVPITPIETLDRQIQQIEVEAPENIEGEFDFSNLFRNGGMSKKEEKFINDISKHMYGGKHKKYQKGGVSEPSYNPGDKITFRDEKGNLVSGTIKGIKDGEIILED